MTASMAHSALPLSKLYFLVFLSRVHCWKIKQHDIRSLTSESIPRMPQSPLGTNSHLEVIAGIRLGSL